MSYEALETAQDIIEQTQEWASESLADALSAIDSLSQFDYPTIYYGTLTPPEPANIGTIQPGTVPEMSPDPPQPTYRDIPSISIPSAPSLAVPEAPSISELEVPAAPSISTPSMRTFALPELLGITIPSPQEINFESFNVAPPEPITIEGYDWTLFANEDMNAGNILDHELYVVIKNRLKENILYGGTGLTPEVEDAIWNRDLERNEQALMDSVDKVTTNWAKRGFPLPDGLLAHSIAELQKEYMNRRIDRSREIAVEQAKLEQSNIFKSMEIGTGLYQICNDLLLKYVAQTLETQKAVAAFFNQYVDLQIKAQSNVVDIYKAQASVYEAKIRTELGKVDVFKAQIEAELAKANLNHQQVQLYSAQITAEIARYNGEIAMNKGIIDIFSAQVQSILAQAQIDETRLRAYAESVRAIIAQAEVYRAQLNAIESEARIGVANAQVNVSLAEAWAKKVGVNATKYEAMIERFKAENQYNLSVAELSARVAQINAGIITETAKMNLGYSELTSKNIQAKAEALLEAAKSVATMTSHLAAGAMAGASAHASVQFSENQPHIPTTP